MFRRLAWLLPLLCLCAAPASRGTVDWPGWRGPQRTGISAEQPLLQDWPEGGPKLLWKITGVGEGYSTPSVTREALYVMGNKDGKEWILALDPAREGQVIWATAIGEVRHNGAGYPGPRSTPTVDGDRLFALGLNGDLVCLATRDGQIVWQRNLVSDFGGAIPNWGYTESVLIDGPWVICTPGGKQATLAALEKTTGTPVWQSPIGDGAGYASIVKAKIDGLDQYVQFTAQGVVGVAAKDGRFLWRYNAPANGTANISTPLVRDNDVFAASGYGTGGGQARITQQGEWKADEVYFTKKMKNHHGGMILLGKHLYGSNDPGVLTCLDWATGDEAWSDRSCGKCSLVCVDGLLITRSEEGLVSLVQATPAGFELHGRFEQPERSPQPAWPHPVVAGGRLYLRDQDTLLCYDVRGDSVR
ncbi:MAG: PQQ-like beta-propeller repeat protein [Pirellulales bacterium]|nr:PQQ-like beta-propeller repeat protein [Pirellulales bacterium]